MNITTPEKVCSELWKRLFLCSLLVIATASIATLRLVHFANGPSPLPDHLLEMACWRLSLVVAFQSAPLVWAHFIYKGYQHKFIGIPLYQTMALLRMPLATWAGGCLITAVILWPQLNA
jgi:hypothetical protein